MAYDPFKQFYVVFGNALTGDSISFQFDGDPLYQFSCVAGTPGAFEFNGSTSIATASTNFFNALETDLPLDYAVEKQYNAAKNVHVVRVYKPDLSTFQSSNLSKTNGSTFYQPLDVPQTWDFNDLAFVSVTPFSNPNRIVVRAWGSNLPIEFKLDNGAWAEGGYEPGIPAYIQQYSNITSGIHTVYIRDGFHEYSQQVNVNPLAATVVHFHSTCSGKNNGLINVSVTGGDPPFNFLWNDGATTEDRSGLGPGSYTVEITDFRGTKITKGPYTINEPPAIVITGGVVNNSDIDISATGGTGTLTYAWNDGVTTQDRSGLPPGNYTVTVT
ncbi:MAG: hypothetical protein HC831_18740, partial [Chloroflexia bacterium]|nr:hypothetical protein [Chloroflexia bacterium]